MLTSCSRSPYRLTDLALDELSREWCDVCEMSLSRSTHFKRHVRSRYHRFNALRKSEGVVDDARYSEDVSEYTKVDASAGADASPKLKMVTDVALQTDAAPATDAAPRETHATLDAGDIRTPGPAREDDKPSSCPQALIDISLNHTNEPSPGPEAAPGASPLDALAEVATAILSLKKDILRQSHSRAGAIDSAGAKTFMLPPMLIPTMKRKRVDSVDTARELARERAVAKVQRWIEGCRDGTTSDSANYRLDRDASNDAR